MLTLYVINAIYKPALNLIGRFYPLISIKQASVNIKCNDAASITQQPLLPFILLLPHPNDLELGRAQMSNRFL